MHGRREDIVALFSQMQQTDLKPDHVTFISLLSNIYAIAGKWDTAAKVKNKMMKGRRVKRTPRCTLIEMNHKVRAFCTGDRSHPQSEQIYAVLDTLSCQMEEAGYTLDTNFVLRDVEEEVKERMLYSHSEKLAIAFGIINISPGTPILLIMNLRVCGDYQVAPKFISKIVKCEIIVRDINHCHHFKDGLCSCGDYW